MISAANLVAYTRARVLINRGQHVKAHDAVRALEEALPPAEVRHKPGYLLHLPRARMRR